MVVIPPAIVLCSDTHYRERDFSADALSWLPVHVGPAQEHNACESAEYACRISSEAVPATHTVQQLEHQAVTLGDWSRLSGTMYKAFSQSNCI